MEVTKVLCMKGGDGEASYAKNSSLQKEIIKTTRPVMEAALLDLYSASFPDKLSVADLGCSCGPNVLSVLRNIVGIVEERCRQLGQKLPEIQVFLNDLPGNDFNSVFLSLQAFYEEREASRRASGEVGQCFIAGVPGSFYGRLFQSRSIHFFHSSSSLHWLSQDPLKNQPHGETLNKRNIHISNQSPPVVVEAFSLQFQKDFSDFLKFRSEEMVVGGHMLLTLLGRKSLDPRSKEATGGWSLLTQVLLDMVQEGYIAEEKVDSFNLPMYLPCAMEIENEIQREGSFSLKCLKVLELPWDAFLGLDNQIEHNGEISEKMPKSQILANWLRPILEPLFAAHFGGDICEELFPRFGKLLEEYHASAKNPTVINIVVSLVRNP